MKSPWLVAMALSESMLTIWLAKLERSRGKFSQASVDAWSISTFELAAVR
jgi:hypothetical protein